MFISAHYEQFTVRVKVYCLNNCASDATDLQLVGERLRAERLRLGFNQEEFAQFGGVNRNTQGSYERGDRSPDVRYLNGVAAHGVDIMFVAAGRRHAPQDSEITPELHELLALFPRLSRENQDIIKRTMFALAAADGALDSPRK
ncbi:helix-turn-helix domain-containing protein [Pseudomonas sp. Marseille-Q5115]|uniref:helix-turn-helix domain-containing protein n=1 Tax=Pseudomonas sp. Marseille-Q5115 TaxID=2866593 RepID=UPI001CE3F994|nr:helix-turn-helix domain-containing protein [Pseudomonas sp. Marseille-Q5115]